MCRFLEWLEIGATYAGAAVCWGITLVFNGVAAAGKVFKEAAHAIGDFAVEMFQRVRKTSVAQKVSECAKRAWKGVETIKKAIDVPETLHTIWLILLWFWTIAMGQACASHIAAPWAAAFCVTGVMYFSLLVASTLFALFLIGTLARPDRS